MRLLHHDPCPTAPRAAAPRPSAPRTALATRLAHPLAVLALAALALAALPLAALALAHLLLASCTDDVAANCPPLAHPEVLTVAAAAGNPCAARKGESGAVLALRVVRMLTPRAAALTEGGR